MEIKNKPRKVILEYLARFLVLVVLVGVPLAVAVARHTGLASTAGGQPEARIVEIRGRMPEQGGFFPDHLTVSVGEPLNLRLMSEDVVHSFAVGQSGWQAVDMKPGEVAETTLVFDQPGIYTFYCTRWCGVNHWRMRGVIEVTGPGGATGPATPPLFETLGIDIDAPHPAQATPEQKPSVVRGLELEASPPLTYLAPAYAIQTSPAEAWQDLRRESSLSRLTDQDLWDLVAVLWQANTTPMAIATGQELYADNCAACHGETGGGDGVFANQVPENTGFMMDQSGLAAPTDFTDPEHMLGANSALLQGKIIRGGMGTGMPYWGPILTEAETWALVAYLWSFQFEMENAP
jgi:mono/diheme cytochrome c family protein/plastocyanin